VLDRRGVGKMRMRRLAAVTMAMLLCPLLLGAAPQSARKRARHPLSTRSTRTARTVQFGLASWYGPGFQRHITASGAPFDESQLTAAHRSLPLGTNVKVTNLKNGQSVIVKVTDRGPRVRGRLIDLSRAAAERLGFKHRGLARVRVAVVPNSNTDAGSAAPSSAGPSNGAQQGPTGPKQGTTGPVSKTQGRQ
jgi:rare lipoprotein A